MNYVYFSLSLMGKSHLKVVMYVYNLRGVMCSICLDTLLRHCFQSFLSQKISISPTIVKPKEFLVL